MSYIKTITYGNKIEIFKYKYAPEPHRRGYRDPDKEKPTEEEKYMKRQANIYQAKKNFRRLVEANLDGDKPLLLSLTYEENMKDIHTAYKDLKSFIQALRYKFGKAFKYIAVPEFQKRGAVHFHALFWKLPITTRQEKKDRVIAGMWGKGFIDVKETDGNQKISGYLAKYMAKAFTDRGLKNQKSYVSSRNVARPVIDRNTILLYALYQVAENAEPLYHKTYPTKWLGECDHTIYERIPIDL